MSYASGKFAFGFCDRCGWRYDLDQLREELEAGFPTGLLVCPTCQDEDHPQNWLNRVKVEDPQSLRNPRPDTSQDASRSLFGWDPVGHENVKMKSALGSVTVTTD